MPKANLAHIWDGPENVNRPSHDDLDKDQLPAEYEQIMNLDIMEPFDWIGLMPMPGSIDAILKRAQALKLLSDSADRVIGALAG